MLAIVTVLVQHISMLTSVLEVNFSFLSSIPPAYHCHYLLHLNPYGMISLKPSGIWNAYGTTEGSSNLSQQSRVKIALGNKGICIETQWNLRVRQHKGKEGQLEED